MQTLRNKGAKLFVAQVRRRHIEVAQKDNKTHHQMVTTEAQWREKHQPSRAYMRAPSNSNFVFLLSQVSHTKKELVEKQPIWGTIKAKKSPNAIVFSSVFSALETLIC